MGGGGCQIVTTGVWKTLVYLYQGSSNWISFCIGCSPNTSNLKVKTLLKIFFFKVHSPAVSLVFYHSMARSPGYKVPSEPAKI